MSAPIDPTMLAEYSNVLSRQQREARALESYTTADVNAWNLDQQINDPEISKAMWQYAAEKTALELMTNQDVESMKKAYQILQRVGPSFGQKKARYEIGIKQDLLRREAVKKELQNSGSMMVFATSAFRNMIIDPIIGLRELKYDDAPTTKFMQFAYDAVEVSDAMAEKHGIADFLGKAAGVVLTLGLAEGMLAAKAAQYLTRFSRIPKVLKWGVPMGIEGGIEYAITPEYSGRGEREIKDPVVSRSEALLWGGVLGGGIDAYVAFKHAGALTKEAVAEALGITTGLASKDAAVLHSMFEGVAPLAFRMKRAAAEGAKSQMALPTLLSATRMSAAGEKVRESTVALRTLMEDIAAGKQTPIQNLDQIATHLANIMSGVDHTPTWRMAKQIDQQREVAQNVTSRLKTLLDVDPGNNEVVQEYAKALLGLKLLESGNTGRIGNNIAFGFVESARKVLGDNVGFTPRIRFDPTKFSVDAEHMAGYVKEMVDRITNSDLTPAAKRQLIDRINGFVETDENPARLFNALTEANVALGEKIAEGITKSAVDYVDVGSSMIKFLDDAVEQLIDLPELARKASKLKTDLQILVNDAAAGLETAQVKIGNVLDAIGKETETGVAGYLDADELKTIFGSMTAQPGLANYLHGAVGNNFITDHLNPLVHTLEKAVSGDLTATEVSNVLQILKDKFGIAASSAEDGLRQLSDKYAQLVKETINKLNNASPGAAETFARKRAEAIAAKESATEAAAPKGAQEAYDKAFLETGDKAAANKAADEWLRQNKIPKTFKEYTKEAAQKAATEERAAKKTADEIGKSYEKAYAENAARDKKAAYTSLEESILTDPAVTSTELAYESARKAGASVDDANRIMNAWNDANPDVAAESGRAAREAAETAAKNKADAAAAEELRKSEAKAARDKAIEDAISNAKDEFAAYEATLKATDGDVKAAKTAKQRWIARNAPERLSGRPLKTPQDAYIDKLVEQDKVKNPVSLARRVMERFNLNPESRNKVLQATITLFEKATSVVGIKRYVAAVYAHAEDLAKDKKNLANRAVRGSAKKVRGSGAANMGGEARGRTKEKK